ncbi:MAG: elongation factor P maturation arginine rhamnosyltransferase EarP [Alysiella sp.]|uniref:elongation factor P maturation arginine rhamnosyltransferase EarP n=1 Tax=Alysiella sp. TaxID=1872483 RepID=UPI0026DAECCD|nr:elongation factor P maturation arginine rhamnosyltransferase EarP [Alysiella sp.]MDO4433243.1 elongation factor P maturation arginine rhamnosyltransferase EarP [Alysiella sp.]
MKPVFWLFCTVIDNFGDIGVSWRLAQELQKRLGAEVHLWLDDFATLHAIAPDATQRLPENGANIALHAWQEGQNVDLQGFRQPDVVIETFACTLPENVRAIIKQTGAIWLNWEYLSAEDWAIRTHLMPSLQADDTHKFFWQMGFLPETGGLLREENVADFFRQPFNQQHQSALPHACKGKLGRWQTEQKQLPAKPQNETIFYLFGYPSPIWAKWLTCWRNLGWHLHIKLAGNTIARSLQENGFLPDNAFQNQATYVSGSLEVSLAPFVPQHQFDAVLASADVLFVRGEDSFVRAQYSGKPFFWHIYPQENLVHLDKLDAFWRMVWTEHQPIQAAFIALSDELNGAHILSDSARQNAWQTLWHNLAQWQNVAQNWQTHLFRQPDAVSRLAAWLQGQNQ